MPTEVKRWPEEGEHARDLLVSICVPQFDGLEAAAHDHLLVELEAAYARRVVPQRRLRLPHLHIPH